MAYEKIVTGSLGSVTQLQSAVTIEVGGSSAGGTLTRGINPLVGHKYWDSAAYWVECIGNNSLTTISIHGNVLGTSFPIARRAISSTISGATTIPTTTGSGGTVRPHAIEYGFVSGTSITSITPYVMAKSNKGLAAGQGFGQDRVVEHAILAVGNSLLTGSGTNGKEYVLTNYVVGITADKTLVLAAGQSLLTGLSAIYSLGGLARMKQWDHCDYYFNSLGTSGNWTINIQAVILGKTVTCSSLATGAMGTTATGLTRLAFTNQFNGPQPTPTQIFVDNIGGGVSAQFAGTVYAVAKTSRGQQQKI